MVTALDSIRMNYSKLLVKHDSTTPLLCFLLVAISGLHVLSGKDALLKLEVDTVSSKNSREDLAFNLLYELIDGIAECEIALESGMGMKVDIHE
jgi:hypothetical protein